MPRLALLCAMILLSAHAARGASPRRSARAADLERSREALRAYTARHGLVIGERGVDVHPTVALIAAHRSYYGKTHDPSMEWKKKDPRSKPAFLLAEREFKRADGRVERRAIGFTDAGRIVVDNLDGDWQERYSTPKGPSTADYQRFGMTTISHLERAANKLLLRIAGMEGARADEAAVALARTKVSKEVQEAEELTSIARGERSHPDLELLFFAHQAREAAGDVEGSLVLGRRDARTLSADLTRTGTVKLVVRERDGNVSEVTSRLLHSFGIRRKANLDRLLESAIAEIAPEDLGPAPR